MKPRIHPTAIVDAKAELAADVEVGPWAYIGPDCTVAEGCVIQMRGPVCKMRGIARVDGEVVTEADMAAMVRDR